jgi:sortase A
MLYRYVKSVPKKPRSNRASRVVSFLLIALGGGILLWTFWPIVSFSLMSNDLFASTVTPIQNTVSAVNAAGQTAANLSPVAYAAANNTSSDGSDLSNPNAWFPTAPQKKVVTQVNTYTLSIPKLKIQDALVTISGDDLDTSLVHYGGTALPGEYGNTVIFGHSTLPQFYNPKNFKTIFSMLPSLKVGDEIDVTYDGISYTYVVYDMTVSEPSDLSALAQRFDDSYLTLITCVPPGTWWQRLHVFAKLNRPSS